MHLSVPLAKNDIVYLGFFFYVHLLHAIITLHLFKRLIESRIFVGTLADKYEKLGGEVKWMGKPGEVI